VVAGGGERRLFVPSSDRKRILFARSRGAVFDFHRQSKLHALCPTDQNYQAWSVHTYHVDNAIGCLLTVTVMQILHCH